MTLARRPRRWSWWSIGLTAFIARDGDDAVFKKSAAESPIQTLQVSGGAVPKSGGRRVPSGLKTRLERSKKGMREPTTDMARELNADDRPCS
jgi:hypothetical protein